MERYFRLHSIGAALVTMTTLLIGPAFGQELSGTLKKIKETGVITIGHREAAVPFSYYDAQHKVVGYAIDLCMKIADAVKNEIKLTTLEIKLVPVTPATRIASVTSGTVDLECGSTTNNLERQKQVSFTITHFVSASRFVSKKASNVKTLDDLRGKTVVSTAGSTSTKLISDLNAQKGLDLNIVAAKDYAEAFHMVETDQAAAFVMDDVLLYSFVANSSAPSDYVISADALSTEPYGIMLRRDDPDFKKVVDTEMIRIYRSGEINAIYDNWFRKPIPPKGTNLQLPMSAAFKKVIATPTDSGDPLAYEN